MALLNLELLLLYQDRRGSIGERNQKQAFPNVGGWLKTD
jgi:hypothetical protein